MKELDYLNNTVYCKLAPSLIHGVGVFAIRDIPASTKYTDHTNSTQGITYYTFSHQQFNELHPEIQSLILDRTSFEPELIEFISPNQDAILRSFMNHSDKPNTDGIYTLRAIKAGTELTVNFFTATPNMHKRNRDHYNFTGSNQ